MKRRAGDVLRASHEQDDVGCHDGSEDAVKRNVVPAIGIATSKSIRPWTFALIDTDELSTRFPDAKPIGQSSNVLTAIGIKNSTELVFTVPGEPVAWERAGTKVQQPFVPGMKARVRHFTKRDTRAFEQRVFLIAMAAARSCGWTVSDKDHYDLHIEVYREHKDKGGDFDNYLKAICDALNPRRNRPGVWFDDRRVSSWSGFIRQVSSNYRIYVRVRKI